MPTARRKVFGLYLGFAPASKTKNPRGFFSEAKDELHHLEQTQVIPPKSFRLPRNSYRRSRTGAALQDIFQQGSETWCFVFLLPQWLSSIFMWLIFPPKKVLKAKSCVFFTMDSKGLSSYIIGLLLWVNCLAIVALSNLGLLLFILFEQASGRQILCFRVPYSLNPFWRPTDLTLLKVAGGNV